MARKLIWKFRAGTPTKTDYDTQVSGFPLNANGRPDPASTTIGQNVDFGRLQFSSSYEVPTMDADGRIRCFSASDMFDQHCMLVVRSPLSDAFTSSFYLLAQRTYEFNFTVDFESAQSVWDGNSGDFRLFWQLHPATYPGGWQLGASKSPPVALYVRNGVFELQVRGSTAASPTIFEEDNDYTLKAMTNGVHTFKVIVRQDYTGATSLTEAWVDGVQYARVTHTNSINFSGLGAVEACNITFGNYGGFNAPNYPVLLYEALDGYEIIPETRIDADKTWKSIGFGTMSTQTIEKATTDTPYVCFDFSNRIPPNAGIVSIDNIEELATSDLTIEFDTISADGQKACARISGGSAGTYALKASVTLSTGSTRVLTGKMKVV